MSRNVCKRASTDIRLFRLNDWRISWYEGEERDGEKKKRNTHRKSRVHSKMYVWKPYVNEVRFSVHQLCMISIHRLDKLLGPSSMNLERNWSQCKIRSLLMLKGRKPGEVLWCVFDTISTRFNNIDSPGDWNWVDTVAIGDAKGRASRCWGKGIWLIASPRGPVL